MKKRLFGMFCVTLLLVISTLLTSCSSKPHNGKGAVISGSYRGWQTYTEDYTMVYFSDVPKEFGQVYADSDSINYLFKDVQVGETVNYTMDYTVVDGFSGWRIVKVVYKGDNREMRVEKGR